MDSNEEKGQKSTVSRTNAATLLYVSTPRPFLGAPKPTWIYIDLFVLLVILGLGAAEVIAPFWLVIIIPIHIIGVILRARTPHIHQLTNAFVTQPRASWRGNKWRKPRAPGAHGLMDG